MKKKKIKELLGESLFELLIVITVATLVVVSIVALSTRSTKNSTFASNSSVANRYASEGIEWVKQKKLEPVDGDGRNGWEDLIWGVNGTMTDTGTYCLSVIPTIGPTGGSCNNIPNTNFQRLLQVTCLSTYNTTTTCNNVDQITHLNINIVINWTENGVGRNVISSTILTEWE